jgi:hypothetical protein
MNAKDIAKPGEFYITVEHIRDRFAMAALAGITVPRSEDDHIGGYDCDDIARVAYELADAMLKARDIHDSECRQKGGEVKP